nr:hypothetical protein BaRGS_031229 [Batillaria attramentaria]
MQQKIQTFLNTCLRRIFNIRWPEKIRSEELWERAGQEPVAKQILRRKWGWIGHTPLKPSNIEIDMLNLAVEYSHKMVAILTGRNHMLRPAKKYPLAVPLLLRHIACGIGEDNAVRFNKGTGLFAPS